MGDAVFMVIYTRVCKAARRRLVEAGCHFQVAYDHGAPLWCPPDGYGAGMREYGVTDGAYLDDSLYMQEDASAAVLLEKVSKQIAIIYSVFTLHGLTVNMSAGKTECLLRLVGAGRKALQWRVHRDGGVPFLSPQGVQMKLTVNRYYKHMGCLSRPDCRVASEVNHRVGEAMTALRSISTTVLGAKALPQAVKLQAVGSFVLSRLVYNAGIWPELGRSELAKVHGGPHLCVEERARRARRGPSRRRAQH